MTEPPVGSKRVLVCQGNSCRQGGGRNILEQFQQSAPAHVRVEACGCLGQCGNGPMVLVLPEQVWYFRVQAADVRAIAQRHLQAGIPVQALLYPKFHPKQGRNCKKI